MPPRSYFEKLLDNTLKVYFFMWDRKDPSGRFLMAWPEINLEFNSNTFRTALRKLRNADLLTFSETIRGFDVKLTLPK